MSTVTPPVPDSAPDPSPKEESSAPIGVPDLIWKLSGDHRRAAWCLVFTMVFLLAFVAVVAMIGPVLPAIATGLLGTAGGSAAVGVVQGVRRSIRGKRNC